jgi:hypothetical protein
MTRKVFFLDRSDDIDAPDAYQRCADVAARLRLTESRGAPAPAL